MVHSMTWQQACDAIDQFDEEDRAEFPAVQWYELALDAAYDPDEDEAADRGDWEFHQRYDQ
jgi:hypothetical protein